VDAPGKILRDANHACGADAFRDGNCEVDPLDSSKLRYDLAVLG
jgi:hypothetical protein